MLGSGWGGLWDGAQRLVVAAFGSGAAMDGKVAVANNAADGGHLQHDAGEEDNEGSPARKKRCLRDGLEGSGVSVGPEGGAPSPSTALGGPPLLLPATFSTAGPQTAAAAAVANAVAVARGGPWQVYGIRLDDHKIAFNKLTVAFNELQRRHNELTLRTIRLEGLLDQADTTQDAAANVAAAAAEAVVRARHGFGHAGILNDQHAMIEALTQRTNRLEGLLAQVDTPQAEFNYRLVVRVSLTETRVLTPSLTLTQVRSCARR
eukprot:scaffold73693_cov33-Phaeocystis_antarctica.AAC.2